MCCGSRTCQPPQLDHACDVQVGIVDGHVVKKPAPDMLYKSRATIHFARIGNGGALTCNLGIPAPHACMNTQIATSCKFGAPEPSSNVHDKPTQSRAHCQLGHQFRTPEPLFHGGDGNIEVKHRRRRRKRERCRSRCIYTHQLGVSRLGFGQTSVPPAYGGMMRTSSCQPGVSSAAHFPDVSENQFRTSGA